MSISDSHYYDPKALVQDVRLSCSKDPETKFSSMMIERKIRNELGQIDKMLDKLNSGVSEDVRQRCFKSLERSRRNLTSYEYYSFKEDN
ncbi:hypothetical protein D3C81_808750 [compost metagenome]